MGNNQACPSAPRQQGRRQHEACAGRAAAGDRPVDLLGCLDDVHAGEGNAERGADRKLIAAVNVFDVFEGASLGEGKKSVAIEVVFQPTDKTLTDEDFEALTARIVGNVAKTTGGTLRA